MRMTNRKHLPCHVDDGNVNVKCGVMWCRGVLICSQCLHCCVLVISHVGPIRGWHGTRQQTKLTIPHLYCLIERYVMTHLWTWSIMVIWAGVNDICISGCILCGGGRVGHVYGDWGQVFWIHFPLAWRWWACSSVLGPARPGRLHCVSCPAQPDSRGFHILICRYYLMGDTTDIF